MYIPCFQTFEPGLKSRSKLVFECLHPKGLFSHVYMYNLELTLDFIFFRGPRSMYCYLPLTPSCTCISLSPHLDVPCICSVIDKRPKTLPEPKTGHTHQWHIFQESEIA